MTPVDIVRGDGPIVLGLPHAGTWMPAEIWETLTARGRELPDTDWHIERLYGGLLANVTAVRARFHRYVVDPNRPPSGQSLYPGRNTTDLVPLTDFDGAPIWQENPSSAETEQRRRIYHAAYHAALAAEIERIKSIHGMAILYDCHSIRSFIPHLFEGVLPDFNIGTDAGRTCASELTAAVVEICAEAKEYTTVLNGRFKGGWTTRHYGRPENGVHALQMELAQSTYLQDENAGWAYDPHRAARLRPYLAAILATLADLAPRFGTPR
ncbi:MAG: N-formylglutamate deformylase [Pseudomonadota bacterium]